MVDTGSSADILSLAAFKELQIDPQKLKPWRSSVIGFTSSPIQLEGMITLPVTLGEEPLKETKMIDFVEVNVNLAYNGILSRRF